MHSEIAETTIQPYIAVTDPPLTRDIDMVVEIPNGAAMIANESPRMLIMLRWRGSSLL